MVEYSKINLNLSESQLRKIQSAVKNKDSTTIRIGGENFNKNELIHELYLTDRQMKKLKKINK